MNPLKTHFDLVEWWVNEVQREKEDHEILQETPNYFRMVY